MECEIIQQTNTRCQNCKMNLPIQFLPLLVLPWKEPGPKNNTSKSKSGNNMKESS